MAPGWGTAVAAWLVERCWQTAGSPSAKFSVGLDGGSV